MPLFQLRVSGTLCSGIWIRQTVKPLVPVMSHMNPDTISCPAPLFNCCVLTWTVHVLPRGVYREVLRCSIAAITTIWEPQLHCIPRSAVLTADQVLVCATCFDLQRGRRILFDVGVMKEVVRKLGWVSVAQHSWRDINTPAPLQKLIRKLYLESGKVA